MAATAYSYTIDTLVSSTLDAYSGDPVNLITKSGEKFLNRLKEKGRVFFIKDCEKVRHPLLIGHGEDSSYYIPDESGTYPAISGAAQVSNLGTAAQEIMTQCNFSMVAGTRNINMPQSMPPGDVINYVDTLVGANMMKIWNEEEQLWWENTTARSPFSGDPDSASTVGASIWAPGYPMNAKGLVFGGTDHGTGATFLYSDEAFAGVKVDDVGDEFSTQTLNSVGDPDATADRLVLVDDLQSIIDSCGFSEVEHCTDIFTTKAVYEGLLMYLRDYAALPSPIQASGGTGAGWDHSFDFGGVKIHWSRYLTAGTPWDFPQDASSIAACDPVIGLNLNSLRMNVVAKPNSMDGKLGFIHQVGSMIPHALLTNVFKRIAWKRNYSFDNGRRSMFVMTGVND